MWVTCLNYSGIVTAKPGCVPAEGLSKPLDKHPLYLIGKEILDHWMLEVEILFTEVHWRISTLKTHGLAKGHIHWKSIGYRRMNSV